MPMVEEYLIADLRHLRHLRPIKIPGRILTPLGDALAEPLKRPRIHLPRPFDGGGEGLRSIRVQ